MDWAAQLIDVTELLPSRLAAIIIQDSYLEVVRHRLYNLPKPKVRKAEQI